MIAGGTRSRLATFGQGKQVVLPNPVGIGLDELVTVRAGSHANPRDIPAFVRVELVGALLDELHDIRNGILPAPTLVWLRAARMGDTFMWAVSIRLVDAVNPVVSHAATLSLTEGPVRSAGSLIFKEGPARVMVFKHA